MAKIVRDYKPSGKSNYPGSGIMIYLNKPIRKVYVKAEVLHEDKSGATIRIKGKLCDVQLLVNKRIIQ